MPEPAPAVDFLLVPALVVVVEVVDDVVVEEVVVDEVVVDPPAVVLDPGAVVVVAPAVSGALATPDAEAGPRQEALANSGPEAADPNELESDGLSVVSVCSHTLFTAYTDWPWVVVTTIRSPFRRLLRCANAPPYPLRRATTAAFPG
jgi:hypothetical protein